MRRKATTAIQLSGRFLNADGQITNSEHISLGSYSDSVDVEMASTAN